MPPSTLTDLELELMKIVWQRKQATVRDVYEALRERRPIAYTTVLTMMKILEQKGFVERDQSARAHVYRPLQARGPVIGEMVREFVEKVFNGAAEPLAAHLIEEHDLAPEEIERLLERARAKRGGRP